MVSRIIAELGCVVHAVLVAVRNWPSTLVRVIIAPFVFIALIWLVNQVRTTASG